MVELLRRPRAPRQEEAPMDKGTAAERPVPCYAQTAGGSAMGSGETRCVVGSDVAKQTQVVCALGAPGGAIRLKPSQLEASMEDYARGPECLQSWAEPAATVMGREATGTLWEPLYDFLTQEAGYHVLLREPAADRLLGQQPGRARQDRWDSCPHLGARP